MALSNFTAFTSVNNQAAASGTVALVTGSLSPPSDCLLVVGFVEDSFNNTAETATITTSLSNVGSWTYKQINTTFISGHQCQGIAWAKVTGAPGTGTITVTFNSDTDLIILMGGWLTGQDPTTPVPQAAISNTGTTGTALSGTLGSTPATTSEVLTFATLFDGGQATNPTGMTEAAGYTEAAQAFGGNTTFTFSANAAISYKNGSSPTTAVAYTAAFAEPWAIFGLEVALAAPVAAIDVPALLIPNPAIVRSYYW